MKSRQNAEVIAELAMVNAAVCDPTVTGFAREPMRPLLVPYPDRPTARTGSPGASPWWRTLDGTWDVRFFDRLADVPADVLAASGPGPWEKIELPGAWTTQRDSSGSRFVAPHYTNVIMPFDAEPPSVPIENPVGVHRRLVTIPREWAGRRVVLRVGAAESVLGAFVDGRCVGVGTDSRLPNEFDITSHVRAGRRSTIVLVVVRWSASTWVEDQDQWWHGGVQRSVTLYSTAPSHLATVKALPGLVGPDDVGGPIGTLDLEMVVDGPARRERGWKVHATVESLGARGHGRRRELARTPEFDVPVWNPDTEGDQLLSAMFVEPGVVRTRLEVPGVHAWSHETPVRYRVLVSLVDPDGALAEVDTLLTGFRSLEIADNELRINGRAVLIHGVNLHEHDPARGRAVTAETTRTDLLLMKAHHLNAVRAAHYPHDEHLAELCDELGLYLVDEANVESHGRQASLCNDPRYVHQIVERVERMVRRDQHHPSIIMWSLGNESGDGAAHAAAAAWVRHHDPTRPLHYEGPLMHDLYATAPVTDVVCPMYSAIDDIVAWARSGRDTRRPLIMCEYSHAMGNSNGSLADYWDAFESTHGLQGGFMWEWLDHGLERDQVDGEPVGLGPSGMTSWGYGGDFGEQPHDSNFICDGLVSPDRLAHPAMAEVRHLGRPLTVEWADDRHRRLRIHNRRWFTGADDVRAEWRLRVDGELVERGKFELPTIAPRSEAVVPMPLRMPRVPEGAEAHLDVVWTSGRKTPWVRAGEVLAVDQLTLEPPRGNPAGRSPAGRSPARTEEQLVVVDGGVDVASLSWRPTIFRALTDNDGLKQGWVSGWLGNFDRWITQQGLDRSTWSADPARRRRVDGTVVVTERGTLQPAGQVEPVRVQRRITTHDDGWVNVAVTLDLPTDLDDPPRVGTEWELPGAFERVEWFGEGPHESYPDRRAAVFAARHSENIDDMYEDYVVPQEHGHRGALRWLALTPQGGRGVGMLVVADPHVGAGTFGAAVRRHSDSELWSSFHTDELARLAASRPRSTFMYLDVATRGLGTGSCGPDALDRYRIRAGRHLISFWTRHFDPRSEDPGAMAALVRRR